MIDPDAKPSANLEATVAGFAAFSSGDLEKSLESLHPEVEWHIAFRLPDLPLDKEVCRGRDDVRTLWNAFRSVWETITIDLEEILWEGRDSIVARARFNGKGGASGIEIDRVLFYVMELRDEMLWRIRNYDTAAEAMGAAQEGLDGD